MQKRKSARTKMSNFQVHPAAEPVQGSCRLRRTTSELPRSTSFLSSRTTRTRMTSISSARWIIIEMMHRLFFNRQVRLCRITLCPSLGKIGCQVAGGRLLEVFSTCCDDGHSLIQASRVHAIGYNAHHPDCTWPTGIFIHTFLFSCKLRVSRAGFKWDFDRHRSGGLQTLCQ